MYSLPARPSIGLLKKQAKKLLKLYRAQSTDALSEVALYHPQPASFSGLRDAQLVVARSYGFPGWKELDEAVTLKSIEAKTLSEKATLFIQLGCVQYSGGDTLRNYQRARDLLAAWPEIAEFSFYSALVANNLPAVSKYIESDSAMAKSSGGPLGWPALLYVTYSRIGEPEKNRHALEIARLLLELGADPNSHVMLDIYRFSTLTGAMGEGEQGVNQPPHQYADELALLLLESGASPNDGQGLYNTMFTDSGDKWLELLLSHGLGAAHRLDWEAEDGEAATSTLNYQLSSAADSNRIERVRTLLAAGANPNSLNTYNGRSVHTNALLAGHDCIAQLLSESGATPEELNIPDKFRIACVHRDLNTIKEMLRAHPTLKDDASLLHAAAEHCDGSLVKQLIELGFDINCQSKHGRTLLHHYALSNEPEQIKYLLNQGANVDILDASYQSTAAGFAAYSGSYEVMRLLLDETDDLLAIVSCAYLERVRELLSTRPDLVNQRDATGNTVLHEIGSWLHDEPEPDVCAALIELLVSAGADLSVTNKKQQTPIEFKEAIGEHAMADLLSEY